MYWLGPTISQRVPLPVSASWPLRTRPSTLTGVPSATEPTTLPGSTLGAERMRRPPGSRTTPTHTSSTTIRPLTLRGAGVGVGGGGPAGVAVAVGDGAAATVAVAGA